MHRIHALLLFICACISSSCVHRQQEPLKFGMNPARKGFVPARIALLRCMVWPERATKISGLPLSNTPMEERQKLCEDIDKYVADGFDNQPFMKGLSPKLSEKFYGEGVSDKETIVEALAREWKSLPKDCQDCRNLPTFYAQSIEKRASWQLWLNKFSVAAKGADALMVPLLLSSNTRLEDDRGIWNSIRSGAFAILLLDTNDGSIVWSGGRETEVIYKALSGSTPKSELKTPTVEELKRRILMEAVWLEFPGRQVYR